MNPNSQTNAEVRRLLEIIIQARAGLVTGVSNFTDRMNYMSQIAGQALVVLDEQPGGPDEASKEAAKGALLHGMLQLRVCAAGSGSLAIKELKAKALKEEAWITARLEEHGLTWDDLKADWSEFYKDQIPPRQSATADSSK